jgi:quercetin dioxygenase-like cupin family protein
MTSENEIYSKSKEILDCKFVSCDVYYMKPGTKEEKHYHKGTELVFVLDGTSKTHQKGRFYLYKSGKIHEVVNDSPNELVLVCLTVPSESKENTVFV